LQCSRERPPNATDVVEALARVDVVGVVWFVIGLVLIIAYQVYAHRTLWEKVPIMEQRADGLEVGRTP